MDEQGAKEFQRKSHFDLWVHQNTLFWSRFNLFYIVQGAFLAVAASASSNSNIIFAALGITICLTMWLYSTIDQDRRLRNHHAAVLKNEFGFDPLPDNVTTPPGFAATTIQVGFQLLIFLPFVVIDIIAALHFASSK